MVRRGNNMHLVYLSTATGPRYLHSGNGGSTWDTSISIGSGGQPYIACTGCLLHVVWLNQGKIYYKRNPTGNCNNVSTGVAYNNKESQSSIYPNPFRERIIVKLKNMHHTVVDLVNMAGQTLLKQNIDVGVAEIKTDKLPAGSYFIQVTGDEGSYLKKMIKE